jgi:predicted ATPase
VSFLKSIKFSGFLSFAPDSSPVLLSPLNVLIGPNASGKSNLIEGIELLHATPTAFASAIRDGGGAHEWLWKGSHSGQSGRIDVTVHGQSRGPRVPDLRYGVEFVASNHRTEVIDEVIENAEKRDPTDKDVFFYYRFQNGHPAISICETGPGPRSQRFLERQSLKPDESVLSQRKDPDAYPELTWLGERFAQIQMFREWSFGRYGELRKPQPTDLPTESLLPDSRNLGLVLNQIEHSNAGVEFNRLMSRFLPRYQRFSTRVQGSTIQFYLHEEGLKAPVPATRLSDGTIRFMAMLAMLLSPAPPSLICLEEPELGLHPDAVCLLADLLVDASSRTQIIVTTHADELISALTEHANSVLVCEHRGGTVLERVDSAELAHWLERYRLGEIWRIGELGGNP